MKKHKYKIFGLIVVIILNILVGSFIASQIVSYRHYPFDSDEARHATRSLELAFDLRRADMREFLKHSYENSVYPPGLAWFQSFIFLVFGATPLVARLCSLACLIGVTLVFYAFGLELHEDVGWLIGLTAVALTLTSQTLLVHAALTMLEIPGLLVSSITLLVFLQSTERPTKYNLVATSLLLSLALLTKYPYGIVVIATVGLVEALSLFSHLSGFRATFQRWLWLFLPFGIISLIWFMGEDKVADMIYYATLQPKQTDWYSLKNLTFYPRSIALHYLPSPFFVPAVLAGIFWAGKRWDKNWVRIILTYLSFGLILMTLKESNNPRFVATVAPAVYFPFSAMFANLIDVWIHHKQSGYRKVLPALLIIFLSLLASLPTLAQRFTIFPDLLKVELETTPQANKLSAWLLEQTDGQRIYSINAWDQFSRYAMEWYLATHSAQSSLYYGDFFVPNENLERFTPETADSLKYKIRFYSTRYVVVFDRGGRQGHFWKKYAHDFDDFLVPVAYRKFQFDFYALGDWLKTAWLTRSRLIKAQSKNYAPLDVKVTIYRLLDAPPFPTHNGNKNTKIDLGSPEDNAFIGAGWHFSEYIGGVQGRWSGDIPTSTVYVNLPPSSYTICFRALPYPPNQVVKLKVNDIQITTLSMTKDWTTYTATIPAQIINEMEPTEIQLIHRALLSPYEQTEGESSDKRSLGTAYDWIVIDPESKKTSDPKVQPPSFLR
jgi:hypothetical protein